jgi:hypothetical protein
MKPKLLSLIALVVASVAGVPWPSLAQQPLRIGSSLSLTGKYALQGVATGARGTCSARSR